MVDFFRRLVQSFASPATSRPAKPWIGRTFGIDLRSLALFRVSLGLILLIDLVIRLGDLSVFYTDSGVLPRGNLLADFPSSDWLYSFHLLSGGAFFQLLLFLVAAAAVVCLILGYRTRAAAILSFVLLCSLQNRNPFILQGGDMLIRVMHFWALFLPLGMRWSLDRRFSRETVMARPLGVSPKTPNQVVTFASAAILFQVAFMYWFTAGLKSDPIWWRDGLGIYYALNVDQFATPLGKWMLGHEWLHRPLSYATYFLEAFGPLFAFVPWKTAWFRLGTVGVFVLFHLFGIRLTMELGLFQWTSAAIWLLFLPAMFWEKLLPGAIRWMQEDLPRLNRYPIWKGRARRSLSFLKLGMRPESRLIPLPQATPPRYQWWLQSGVILLLFTYTLGWNVRAADFDRYVGVFPRKLNWIGEVTGLRQYWSMFSPKPMLDDGWYVFTGRTRDGDVIDLRTRQAVTWEKPELVSATYKNQRWRKYLMNLRLRKNQAHRKLFVKWMMKAWNQSHAPEEQIVAMQLVYVQEMTTRTGTKPINKLVLHEFNPVGDWRTDKKNQEIFETKVR